jgi:hypothetical protein
MKKIIFLILIFTSTISFSQRIYVEPPVKEVSSMWWFYGEQNYDYLIKIKEEEFVIEEIDPISERDCVILTYESQIGVREKGNNSGTEVEMYLASAGLAKGNPWCASFIQWSIMQCTDIKIESAGWVPSWFPKKKLIFVRGQIDLKPPQAGDLIGIWFADKGRLAHIGFFESESNDFTTSVEGNTNEAGSREGDGVYRKKRITRTIHSIYRWLP